VDYLDSNISDNNSADSLAKFPFKALGGRIKTAGNSIKSSAGNAAAGLLASSSQVAGLAIKNPPKKTHTKNPLKMFSLGFLCFLHFLFYENNTNFSL
jgi:hypothetical protein